MLNIQTLSRDQLNSYYGDEFPGYGIEANPDDISLYQEAVNNIQNLTYLEKSLPILRHKDSWQKRATYKENVVYYDMIFWIFFRISAIASVLLYLGLTCKLCEREHFSV